MKASSENPYGEPVTKYKFVLISVIFYILYFGLLYGLYAEYEHDWNNWLALICRILLAVVMLYVIWSRSLRFPAMLGIVAAVITYWKIFGFVFFA